MKYKVMKIKVEKTDLQKALNITKHGLTKKDSGLIVTSCFVFRITGDTMSVFLECLQAKAHYVAVENLVSMKLANLPRPSFYADPSCFGVKYTKKTCYWVKNLPPLMPTIQYPNPKCYVDCSRGKYRSRTFPQLAQAIAIQWSEYILDKEEESKKITNK